MSRRSNPRGDTYRFLGNATHPEGRGALLNRSLKVDTEIEKKSEFKANGMDVVNFSWDGEDKEGPCKISVTICGVSDGKALVFLFWASHEGEKKHEKALGEIAASIKPVGKKKEEE